MKTIINGIEIDVRSEKSCYVTINGVIFYLEHSDAAPMYVDCWVEGSTNDDDFKAYHLIKENK